MRRRGRPWWRGGPVAAAAGLLAIAAAGAPAGAGPVPVTGWFRLQIGASEGLAFELPLAGSIEVARSGERLVGLSAPAGLVDGTVQLPITDPAAFPILGVTVVAANAAGRLAETAAGGFGGVLPILGLARTCLFMPCDAGPPANLTIPLSVLGAGGTLTRTGVVDLTVRGAPWTTRPVTPVPTLRSTPVTGFRHGPASHTGSTALASGVLEMVTPVWIRTSIGTVPLPAHGRLTLHFVPEPASALLVGLGAAALATGARRRR